MAVLVRFINLPQLMCKLKAGKCNSLGIKHLFADELRHSLLWRVPEKAGKWRIIILWRTRHCTVEVQRKRYSVLTRVRTRNNKIKRTRNINRNPAHLHRLQPLLHPLSACTCCGYAKADMTHIIWDCTSIICSCTRRIPDHIALNADELS